jgi:hypothetical protein
MHDSQDDLLQAARRAWEAVTPQESLPQDRKAALFNEVRRIGEETRQAAYVPLVVRGWRWAFVGSLPVLAIAAVLIVAGDRSQPTTMARLSAEKVDGQVVFTLANGQRDHVVYRSTDPSSFSASDAERLRSNTFAVDANEGPALVFYRID